MWRVVYGGKSMVVSLMPSPLRSISTLKRTVFPGTSWELTYMSNVASRLGSWAEETFWPVWYGYRKTLA